MESSEMRRGFTLPAVLAVTGVVTLVFLVAITALGSLNAEAGSARDRVRFMQRALSAEAQLAFMAATEPMGSSGLSLGGVRMPMDFDRDAAPIAQNTSGLVIETLHLDGRRYLLDVDGPMIGQFQDQAGQINVANLASRPFERLMERLGVAPSMINVLAARQIDYIDTDDLRQPNGAESRDYADAEPANRPLIRPTEWLSILGAREAVQPALWRSMRQNLAADPTILQFNMNTAGVDALKVQFGLSDSQAEAVIAAREIAPIPSVQDMATIAGAMPEYDAEMFYTFPANSIIFTFRDTRSAWVYRGRMTLTPGGVEQPVWIDQTELTEAPARAVADTSDATRLSYAPR